MKQLNSLTTEKKKSRKHISFLTSQVVNCDFFYPKYTIYILHPLIRITTEKCLRKTCWILYCKAHKGRLKTENYVLLTLIEKTTCKSISYPALKQSISLKP